MGGDVRVPDQKSALVDPIGQIQFLERMYIAPEGFLAQGGAKIKFVKGRTGAGKSCFLKEVARRAAEHDYLVSSIDARELSGHRIDDIFKALLKPIDVWGVVRRFAEKVIADLGTNPQEVPPELSYVEWSVRQGRPQQIVAREANMCLERLLFRNADLQRTFSIALMQMTGGVLGTLALGSEERIILEQWVSGLQVTARERNRLNLRQAVDKYSARLMLRSWLHFVRLAGFRGTLMTIDNLDVLLNSNRSKLPYYTRTRRNEVYETIRELIDEVDSLQSFMLLAAARNELFTDANAGLRSYPALWMRIQNEVDVDRLRSKAVNRFAEIIDLDHIWEAAGPGALQEIAELVVGQRTEITPQLRQTLQDTIVRIVNERDMTVSPVKRTVEVVAALLRRWN